jgi:CheY-like chemotaxis protein
LIKAATLNKKGPIVVIEDDKDDQELLLKIFYDLAYTNEIHFFVNGKSALAFLEKPETDPFLIISDIHMPVVSGFDLLEVVQKTDSIKAKFIPYIFLTTDAPENVVNTAYNLSANGVFQKTTKYNDLKKLIQKIIDYWKESM